MRYFVNYLIYIAVLARAIGWSQDTAPISATIWILLAIFGVILFSERTLTRRFPFYPRLYTLVQSGIIISMLYSAPTVDFLSMLFLPLSFQVVQFFHAPIGFVCIGGFSLSMIGMFLFGLEWQAGVTMVLAGSGTNVLMGSFAHLIARTEQRRLENQRLFLDLQAAYRQLKDSAAQSEALAAATERHRLVRELHDTLTQTLFSMNLAVQSAQLSAAEMPQQVDQYLVRLQSLAREASSEVQTLTGQAPTNPLALGDLVSAIQHLAEQRLAQDGLHVSIEVTGKRSLLGPVELNLFRITQEALNNITRHAGVQEARVRLCLESPLASLEVEDEGAGFDLATSGRLKGFGLTGMAERASEIGWKLEVKSHPGHGTRIRIEERVT
jgi:signal transduction histidine kinase